MVCFYLLIHRPTKKRQNLGEHDVIGSALVEFYAAEGMVPKLRTFTLRKPHNMISRVAGWAKSFAVPFFPSDEIPGKPDVGLGGVPICTFVRFFVFHQTFANSDDN